MSDQEIVTIQVTTQTREEDENGVVEDFYTVSDDGGDFGDQSGRWLVLFAVFSAQARATHYQRLGRTVRILLDGKEAAL